MCTVYKVLNLAEKINIKGLLRTNEPLSGHTTFRTGGPADLFIQPADRRELLNLLRLLKREGVPWFILGGGANILVADRGFRGVVIDMKRINRIALNGTVLTLDAGLAVSDGALKAARWGLKGLEFIYAMPGSVGGALWMNARCYSGEISRPFLWADIINENLEFERVYYDSREWEYKKSPFQNRRCVILAGAFRLERGDRRHLTRQMDEIREDRIAKGHFRAPCAGSTFKNNRAFGAPSGQIIEQAGLKGLRIGGAAVSPWHGNILINENNATSGEIARLIEKVQKEVQDRTGFLLEPEVLKIGEWEAEHAESDRKPERVSGSAE